MLQVCMCSLLMCPKIGNFHQMSWFRWSFFPKRKLLYEIIEKAVPKSFKEHIFIYLSVKTLIHSIGGHLQHFKFLL